MTTKTISKPRAPKQTPAARAPKRSPAKPATRQPCTKTEIILALLRRAQGAAIADIAGATGWQNHSVRGFLSAHVKKKMGLILLAEKVDEVTRYRLAKGA